MKSKLVSNKENNPLFHAELKSEVCIAFKSYLTMSVELIEFELLSRVDTCHFVVRCTEHDVLFKIRIVSDNEIEVVNVFSMLDFTLSKLPQQSEFCKGKIHWVLGVDEKDPEQRWSFNYGEPQI